MRFQLFQAASARHLLRHPGQLGLALAGLALGVATIVAVDIAVGSARRAFELSLDAVNGSATHRVVAGPQGIDERVYLAFRLDDSARATPIVEGYVTVRDRTLHLIGIDPFADDRAGAGADESLERLKRWLIEPGTVLLSRRTAAELGIERDDSFELVISGRAHRAVLLGHLEGGSDSLIVTDIANAQEWLDLIGRLSRIDFQVPAGEARDATLAGLRTALPPGLQVEETERASRQSLDMSTAFTTNLQAMSLLALLVGALLVYSAISFAVVQRRRTLGILRALGVTRRKVLTTVLLEAAVLGIVGAAIGVAIGIWIGRELVTLVSRTINDLYFVVSVREVVLSPVSIAKALATGAGVSVVAALVPAIEVAHSPPQLGLRRSALEDRARRASRALAVTSAVSALASFVIVLAFGRSLFAGFVALFLLLAAAAALTPAVLRLLALAAARLAGRRSPIARLALAEVAASLSRTGVAVAALGVALAAMIGVALMVESFRESLHEWLGRTLRADIYVTAPGPGFGRPERRLEPEAIATLLATNGIVDHSASRRVTVPSPRGPISLDALELAAESYAGIQFVAGDADGIWPAFANGAVIASESLAWRLELEPGDSLELVTPDGVRTFPVAGVYREYGNDRGNALIDRAVYVRIWEDEALTSLGLYLAAGIDPAAMIERLRAALAGSQTLYVRANADVLDLSMRIFERTFVITRVLYWLAAGVAAIGLLSALLAWQLERSRELAMLRALGVTPRAAAGLIELQTTFMGLVALLASIPTGLLAALMLIDVINRRAFGWQIDLHVRASPFVDALVLAVAAALAAGLYPAWRAARAPLASEMREE